ncbi:MAG: hypothetical protein O3B21_08980 [Proteobacteria bacterium]|nr:hypothetical protein [Pseudomonadota bacterium]MDA1356386.1 hypothetical protein [Pseudomonadota bacterium]
MTALFRYGRRNDVFQKGGMPSKVELSSKGEISARLHASLQDPIDCNAAYIAAALILLCVRQRIPMPKMAKKSIHVEGGFVVLVLTSGDSPPTQFPS